MAEEETKTSTPTDQQSVDAAAKAASKVPPSAAADETVNVKVKVTSEEKKTNFRARAAKASGYDEAEIDTFNESTRVFATTNGGKYQLLKSGKVRRLQGPRFPREVEEEE